MNKRFLLVILFILVLVGACYSGGIIVDLHMLSQYLGTILFEGVPGSLIATLILSGR